MKNHTKKQIEEAIKHWQGVLKRMDESKSPLLDALCKEFSEDVVMSTSQDIVLDQKTCNKIFNALNPVLFENRLAKIPMKCMNFDAIIRDCIENDKRHGIYDYVYNLNEPLGLFTTYIETEDTNVKDLSFDDKLIAKDHVIYINYDKVFNTSFIFATSILCHELIHYYDALFGEYKEVKRLIAMNKIDKKDELKAEHETKTFIDKLNEANDQGLNVICSGEGKPIEVLDMIAIKKMQDTFLSENQTSVAISPENSTPGVHIYDGRSFRAFSW